MDFRRLDARSVQWSDPVARGAATTRTSAATYRGQGGKIVVQTPTCEALVDADPKLRGGLAVSLTLDERDPVHAAFAEFVSDCEDSVRASPWAQGLRVYGAGEHRFVAWSDALWFDVDGTVIAPPASGTVTTCACLVELQGAWATSMSCGLKIKVLQVRLAPGKLPPPLADDDCRAAPVPVPEPMNTAYGFVE